MTSARRVKSPTLDPAELQAFVATLRGTATRPGDDSYEKARRVFNGMIDKRPLCIVRCADVADVISCVNFARTRGIPLAVRGGSHSVPGFGTWDDGLVVDLGAMRNVRVDPSRRIAWAGGGCSWGDMDHATHPFGLAAPGGIVSSTGVGGLTLGGGFGYLSRKYGLSCDNLISADVVTADGKLRRASPRQNPDLFWAIRGGGGNLGVVTAFEFKLRPVSMVYGGPIFYPLEKAAGALRHYRDYMRTAPREMSAFFAFLLVPPGPPFPEHLHTKPLCGVMCVYSGPLAKGPAVAKPLLDFGPPAFVHTGPLPFPVVQSMFDPLLPHGLHHYWRGDFVNELSDEIIEAHLEFGPGIPTIHSTVHIYPLDGAVHDIARNRTAFAYRDVGFVHVLAAASPDPEPMPGYRDWVRAYWSALHPHTAGGSYVNFLMDEGEDRIAASYRGNYDRLRRIKRRYDPENFFCVNQNIRPAS